MDNTINQQGGPNLAKEEQERRDEELRRQRKAEEDRKAQENKQADHKAGDDRKARDRISSNALQRQDQNRRDEMRRDDERRQDEIRRDEQLRMDDRRQEELRATDRSAQNWPEREDKVSVSKLAEYSRETSQKEDRMSEHNGSIEQVTTAQKNVLDPRDLVDRPGVGSSRGLTEQEMNLERVHYAQSEENRRASSGSWLKRIDERNASQVKKAEAEGKTEPPETTVEMGAQAQERLNLSREARHAKEEILRRGMEARQQQERGMVA